MIFWISKYNFEFFFFFKKFELKNVYVENIYLNNYLFYISIK